MTDTITLYRASIAWGNKVTVIAVKAKETKESYRLEKTQGVYVTLLHKCRIGIATGISVEVWDFSERKALLLLQKYLSGINAKLREEIDLNISAMDDIQKRIEILND